MNFDWLALLRRFWPLVRVRVTAFLAQQIHTLAVTNSIPLSADEAVDIAVFIIGFVESLLAVTGAPVVPEAMVARAAAMLPASANG